MADIKASVGSNGANHEDDVTEIQTLLDVIPAAAGGAEPQIDIDGWCGKNTNAAILHFQKTQKMPVLDGRVDPGKSTIKRLNELVQGPGTRTVAPPDLDPAQLALQSIQQSTIWATAGLRSIQNIRQKVRDSGALAGHDSIELTALAAHFRLTDTLGKARLDTLLDVVEKNFLAAIGVLGRGPVMFHSVSRKQMNIDFRGGEGSPAYVMPANRTRINFSPTFRVRSSGARPGRDWTGDGWGPKCRAAMVLHETIHITDSRGGHDIYEHLPGYLTMSAEVGVHNAASYPSYGAHVFERSTLPLGPRYGAARPAE